MNTKAKTNKKSTKTVKKPTYVVNLVGAQGEYDATLRFALCKYEKNIGSFTTSDILALKTYVRDLSLAYAVKALMSSKRMYILGCGTAFATTLMNIIVAEATAKPKKPNIFKRFWNWITRKK